MPGHVAPVAGIAAAVPDDHPEVRGELDLEPEAVASQPAPWIIPWGVGDITGPERSVDLLHLPP
jgi:hypothetical protein